jgi:hypothetical protein
MELSIIIIKAYYNNIALYFIINVYDYYIVYYYYISNKGLLEECDKVQNLELTGAASNCC